MDIQTILVSTLGSTVLLSGLVWLLKNLLITKLTKSVQHKFDINLAVINSELQEKSAELNSLRDSLLNGSVNRQNLLYEYKVKAVEEVWNNVIALSPAKKVSAILSSVKYDEVLKLGATNPKVSEMFKMLDKDSNHDYFLSYSTPKARPFISELSWALFSAYSSILAIAVMRIEALKSSVTKDFFNDDSILDTVKVALPHQKKFIDEHGIEGLHYLLEELEKSILKELKNILDGKGLDEANIKWANAINKTIKEELKVG